jgi:hypothetical protein
MIANSFFFQSFSELMGHDKFIFSLLRDLTN